MEKQLLIILFAVLSCSCATKNAASFWIANNSNEPVELQSSVISSTNFAGPEVLSKPFLAKPGDIIELGVAPFDQDIPISNLFNYKIANNNGNNLKDPMDIKNWRKITDKKGNTKYILYLVSN
ncbi:hypothetical protein ABN763_11515 [Spongiivirga sp. MCCC 1A20706]|uniref:hypothetical protein n=1 Tax=Spongiivirga sp. MCCC 1A20706 TaxID=3160963 RepID=UPI0039776E71